MKINPYDSCIHEGLIGLKAIPKHMILIVMKHPQISLKLYSYVIAIDT